MGSRQGDINEPDRGKGCKREEQSREKRQRGERGRARMTNHDLYDRIIMGNFLIKEIRLQFRVEERETSNETTFI